MAAAPIDGLRHELADLVHRGHGVRELSLGAARLLRRVVPFDGVCVVALDPASLLPTDEVVEHGLPAAAMARMAELELRGDDVNTFRMLARSRPRAASLSAATGGELDRSRRHREVRRPHGLGDELRAALVAGSATWGGMTLLRGDDRRHFTRTDASVAAAAAPYLAEGLRRAIVLGAPGATGPPGCEETGLLLLAPDDSIVLADPAAERWLADLLAAGRDGARLPVAVTAVASRARGRGDLGRIARARVRTASGQWLVVRGSLLGEGAEARTAVMLEPARSAELAPLIAGAYDLSERERVVTQLVAEGLSTTAIADRLHLSSWTVQDHLKSIFAKVGVRARAELVARLFFGHDPPRLSDRS
jgi:DNA-binding NarL/FixJ family response regulator